MVSSSIFLTCLCLRRGCFVVDVEGKLLLPPSVRCLAPSSMPFKSLLFITSSFCKNQGLLSLILHLMKNSLN